MRTSPFVARCVAPARSLIEPLEDRNLLSVSILPGTLAGTPAVHAAATTSSPAVVTTIPLTINATAGAPFAGDVGEISGLSPSLLPHLKAFINWGDGPAASATALSPGTIYFDAAGLLHVRGTHTYQQAGTFALTVTVIQSPPTGSAAPTSLYTINSKAIVSGNSPGGVTINETVKTRFTAIVGMFNVSPSPIASAIMPVLTALINWGDGTVSFGSILAVPTTGSPTSTYTYEVQGSHTYATAGTFPIIVTVYQQYPLLPGPTPLPIPLGVASPLWIRLVATIDSTAVVTAPATVVTPT